MVSREQISKCYGKDGVSDLPIFPGDITNFGYWRDIDVTGEITKELKIISAVNLYKRMLDKLSLDPSDVVIEVGCGRGVGLGIISSYGPRRVIGLDAVQSQIDHYKGDHKVMQGFAEELPVEDASLDVVLSVEAIQHFIDPHRFINECGRVLRPSGRIAIASFFGNGASANERLKDYIPTIKTGEDVAYPLDEVASWLKELGFKVVVEKIGEYLWEPFQRWCEQISPEEGSFRMLDAYNDGLWDYSIITGKRE